MTGANTNWPNEPPALITPEAVPRACAGMRWAAAPISTEKLAAPEPAADKTPSVMASPMPLVISGVRAVASARSKTPANRTGRGPWRSARAPARGWMAPQTN